MATLEEDLAGLSGPAVYGIRRWNRDWMTIGIAWVQDRGDGSATVWDAVGALDASECNSKYKQEPKLNLYSAP